MRILHLADLHFNRGWFKWVADQAGRYDLMVCAGDLLDLRAKEPLSAQIRWITAWASSLPSFLACSGNHDVASDAPAFSGRWMEALPGAKDLRRGARLNLSGQAFVRADWRVPIPSLRKGDIVISHAPPAGLRTSTSIDGRDHGDLDLSDALLLGRPWLALAGHVHSPRHWRDRIGTTISLNPGFNHGAKVPNHIRIDTEARKACWVKDGFLRDVADLNLDGATNSRR